MSFSDINKSQPHFLHIFPIYFVNLLFLIFSTRTISFVAVENVSVVFFLAPLFYWTIHRPGLMPLWFIFLSGLVIDFATDALLGLHAFSFIVFYILLFKIRRIILSQPLAYHFIIYAFSVFIFEGVRWALVSILGWGILPIYPTLLGFVLNVIAFLPILIILKSLHRLISGYR